MKTIKKMEKIYDYFYDAPKDKEGKLKERKLLGEFEIIYGDTNDYAFSVIGISKKDKEIYNIIGDEVSGLYNQGRGGTKCRIVKINLERCHWV